MTDQSEISEALIRMASERGSGKSICPSEVAKSLFGTGWRKHMDDIRTNAITLQQENKIIITQKGKEISPDKIKGPIRIRIPQV